MNSTFKKLQALGAGEFEHLNGKLIDHLQGTYLLLKQWDASQVLCDAGLYHAVYGTDGFDTSIVSLSQRKEIANIIGIESEAIVYMYCSCDRDYVFSRIGQSSQIQFNDRFTGNSFVLTLEQAKFFCELTVANELELAISSADFLSEHGKGLYALFVAFKPFLSNRAYATINKVLTPLYNH